MSVSLSGRRFRGISSQDLSGLEIPAQGDGGRQSGKDHGAQDQGRGHDHDRRLVDIRHPLNGLSQPIGDEDLDDGTQGPHSQEGSQEGGNDTFEDEGKADGPVRSTDQTHDLRFILS